MHQATSEHLVYSCAFLAHRNHCTTSNTKARLFLRTYAMQSRRHGFHPYAPGSHRSEQVLTNIADWGQLWGHLANARASISLDHSHLARSSSPARGADPPQTCDSFQARPRTYSSSRVLTQKQALSSDAVHFSSRWRRESADLRARGPRDSSRHWHTRNSDVYTAFRQYCASISGVSP